MHFCGIIIKPRSVTVAAARETLGENLVDSGAADWYSKDNYRERLFDWNKQTISLKDFAVSFPEKWDADNHGNETWPFCVLDEEAFMTDNLHSYGFWDLYLQKEAREALLKLAHDAYIKETKRIIDDLLKSDKSEDYDVVLLDYHN